MDTIASMLQDLGFEKVAGILDKKEVHMLGNLEKKFPEYRFFVIPADDVRTKPDKPDLEGLLDEKYQLRTEYRAEMTKIINDINDFLKE